MRRHLLFVLPFVVSLAFVASAQAIVVDMNPSAHGSSTVSYPTDQSYYYGVAMVPGTDSKLTAAGVPTVTSSAPCSDPALPSGSTVGSGGLCWHGGPVIHSNETFALDWEPGANWGITTGYLEQFLRDVADASNTLGDPFAVMTQYTDGTGRAENNSTFGGGCVDQGSSTGATCEFGTATGTGHDFPQNGCTPTGTSFGMSGNNTVCLTDAQLQSELSTMITQTGMLGRTEPDYTPLVVLLTPPGVETCLDSGSKLCSANSTASAQFCSYHGQVDVGGSEVAYVVQPWTAGTGCDEPDVPTLAPGATPQQLETNAGERLASPLSQAMISAVVNPELNGWFSLSGQETNDNGGCEPQGNGLDTVAVSSDTYYLQREFNNAAVMVNDPSTYFGCAPNVILSPSFVVPSAVNQGDVVELDGSNTASTLMVSSYQWDFGDGTTATGPSVEHTYAKGGTYTVKLTVTDRGGNTASLSQTIQVLNNNSQPVVTSTPPTTQATAPPSGLQVKLQLMPQSLKGALHQGIALQVSSNQAADAFAKVWIPRSSARKAHLKAGRNSVAVIGQGTVSGIKNGTVLLRLHMSRSIAKKLSRLKHVTITIQMLLVGAGGVHETIDVAGNY